VIVIYGFIGSSYPCSHPVWCILAEKARGTGEFLVHWAHCCWQTEIGWWLHLLHKVKHLVLGLADVFSLFELLTRYWSVLVLILDLILLHASTCHYSANFLVIFEHIQSWWFLTMWQEFTILILIINSWMLNWFFMRRCTWANEYRWIMRGHITVIRSSLREQIINFLNIVKIMLDFSYNAISSFGFVHWNE